MKPARLPWRAPRARGRDARDPVAPPPGIGHFDPQAAVLVQLQGQAEVPAPDAAVEHGVRRRLGHDVCRVVPAGRGQMVAVPDAGAGVAAGGRCWSALGQPARVPAGGRPGTRTTGGHGHHRAPHPGGQGVLRGRPDTFPRRVVGWSIDASPAAAPGRCPRQYRCVPREKHSWWRKR